MQDEADTKRWQRMKRLFQEASLKAPAEQLEFLAAATADDPKLFLEMQKLMGSDKDITRSLQKIVQAAAHDLHQAASINQQLGAYRILHMLGEGGMGQVFLAERADQQYQKQVAIKIVGVRRPSEKIIERFRNERQMLASLEHPNIAQLFDGGETPDGLPYLVMEYVDGVAIDEYCDTHTLDTRSRLKLFLNVCDAVMHAHEASIIHRDIKASNILVKAQLHQGENADPGRGQPKLLDFGIAKILVDDESEDNTQLGERLLSPLHASPEQVMGDPVTHSTDIYSLGVLLYEMLCGHHPYEADLSSPADIHYAICEDDPKKPSRRITHSKNTSTQELQSIASARGVNPDTLSRVIGGDLDNIVLMALSKEPERRYATVAELKDDIKAFLEHRPVKAREPSMAYRLRKFVRRHRSSVAVAACGMGLLLATLWLSSQKILDEQRVSQNLQEQVAEVESVNTQLTADTFRPPAAKTSPDDVPINGFYKFLFERKDGSFQINEFRMLNDYTLQVRNTDMSQDANRRWFVYVRTGPKTFQAKTSIATYTLLDNGNLRWLSDRRDIQLVPVEGASGR